MLKKHLTGTLVGIALLASSGVAQANSIVNGDFELGLAGWVVAGPCTAAGPGFGATGCFGFDSDPGPHGGANAAYLGAATGGSISQSFSTIAGVTYAVNFFLANGAYLGNAIPNDLVVNWDATTLLHLSDASPQGYLQYTFNIVASGSSTTLSFSDTHVPSFWALDDVSVTQVPDGASTVALLGLGLAGLELAKRKVTRL